MRRLFLSLCAFVCVAAAPAPGLAAEGVTVQIDQSAVVGLPAGTQNVMVGNPAIADANVLDPRTAVVLGRGYGVTNLLAVDARGRTLMDRQVVVMPTASGQVTVIRGGVGGPRPENYACSSRCERTPMPGEIDTDYNRYAAGYTGYAARAAEGRSGGGAAKPGP